MAATPTISAPITGGINRATRGMADNSRNTAVIGAAIANPSRSAKIRFRPNCRNTPATIAMTIGIGTRLRQARTQPLNPSTNISAPVA